MNAEHMVTLVPKIEIPQNLFDLIGYTAVAFFLGVAAKSLLHRNPEP